MSEIKNKLIEWNTADGEKWMQVVVEGGTVVVVEDVVVVGSRVVVVVSMT